MRGQKLVDGDIGSQEGQTIGQLEATVRQSPLLAQARQAQRRLMDELQCQPRLDGGPRLPTPATEEIPCSQTQVFGDKEPDADQVTTDAVGQGLANAIFDGSGVAGAQTPSASRGSGLNSRNNAGTTFMQFFLAGQIRR